MIQKYLPIILFLVVQSAFCQSQLDSLDYIQTSQKINNLFTRFDKQLNTYNLNSDFQFGHNTAGLRYWLSEQYNSTYIKSYDKSIRDEHYFSFSGNYNLSSLFNIGAAVNNSILSDSRRIEINQASVSDATLYSQFTPFSWLTVTPFAGYENNRQIGVSDNGLLYGGEGYLNDPGLTNFLILSQFKFKNEDISPRKNALRYINLSVTNNSSSDFSNQVNYQYFLNRKDFYFTADSLTARQFGVSNNIQSRIETNNILQDRLTYLEFLNFFSLDVTGRIIWRTIDRNTRFRPSDLMSTSLFDTKINEMRVEFESSTNYKSDIFTGLFRLNYSERDEKHFAKDYPGSNNYFYQERSQEESQKNNTSQRITASISGILQLSGNDQLTFSLFQNKLVYNTPSELNYDDRDELLSIARIQYTKTLSPYFNTFVNAEGTFNHVVYIYSEKSSNNNINRILRFAAGGDYGGKYVSSFNSFEVSANYTVYDFEDLLPNYKSYSFRQFTATDSSKIKINDKLLFIHFGYVKLSEQGDLKWAAFSTHPTRYLKEIFSEPKFQTGFSKLIFSLGLRYYLLATYKYNLNQKVPDSRYNSIGPLTEISYQPGSTVNINLLGWYEFIKTDNNLSKQQANLSMQVMWNF